MKRFVLFLAVATLVFSGFAAGHKAMAKIDNHTAQEEVLGELVWQKLQSKEIVCGDLSDDDFHSLGMHFMGIMVGDSHEVMDTMMEQMHGEDGEEQIHIVMGKRMSGCEPDAQLSNMMDGGMMPMMMNMLARYETEDSRFGMTGWWSSPFGFNNQSSNSMMNFGFESLGGFGWIFMILWWVLIIAGIVALVRWIAGQSRGGSPASGGKSALDILKERYAKGEVDKKEFEEKKKDLI